MDVEVLSVPQLLALYGDVIDELKRRGVIRTRNNPVADYCEHLVARAYGLQLVGNSNAGYDAVDPRTRKRYQIKCRRLDPTNGSRQLSFIRNLERHDFDYLVAVLFDRDFTVADAHRLPYEVVTTHARYVQHVNGHRLVVQGKVLSAEGVERIDGLLRASVHGWLEETSG